MTSTITAAITADANAAEARFAAIGGLIRSAECTGASAVIARHVLPNGREGFRLVLAIAVTNNGGAPRLVDLTAAVAAGTWGWKLTGGCVTGGQIMCSAYDVVRTASARMGLADGTLNGYAEV